MKGRKAWVNDGGVRVPCFLKWKGHLPEGKIVGTMTAHIDLLPTLVSMMGLHFKPRKEIHGIDLRGRIYGVDREEERFLYTHVNPGAAVKPDPGAVRSSEWRLTFRNRDRLELTKRGDAGEHHNLADSLPDLADSLLMIYDRWFSPFLNYTIPRIPVGVADSVVIPAHEGFLTGTARYFRSPSGWSNDWVTGLNPDGSSIYWPLMITETADYECIIRYTSPETVMAKLDFSSNMLESELPPYTPVRDVNYNRIDRAAEAIGQSWARISLGEVRLGQGYNSLSVIADNERMEILSVILLKK
jgi:arylsulfatase A